PSFSDDLRRQGDDLHEPLLAQLARHRTEDAGADRLVGVVDQDGGVVVETDVAAVLTPLLLGRPHDHRLDDLPLLDRAIGRGLLHRSGDDVAQPAVLARRATPQVDAGDLLGARVVRHVENSSHLDHRRYSLNQAHYSARFKIWRTRQRLVFDSGRLETISTSSPTLHLFSSSWAWNFFVFFIYRWYSRCVVDSCTTTTTVLSILLLTTRPVLTCCRPLAGAAAVAPSLVLFEAFVISAVSAMSSPYLP